jgi:hypothetical protein
MTREQLEHLIRAAAVISDDDTIVVLGSQAILGQFPDAPASMRTSIEADLFPLHHPERAVAIEGSIGERSPFHETFGYYAEGVSEEVALLPQGWKDRLVLIQNENTHGARGLCLEIHDLLAAKAMAGREKDIAFLKDAALHHLADREMLLRRLEMVPAEMKTREHARRIIEKGFREANYA